METSVVYECIYVTLPTHCYRYIIMWPLLIFCFGFGNYISHTYIFIYIYICTYRCVLCAPVYMYKSENHWDLPAHKNIYTLECALAFEN